MGMEHRVSFPSGVIPAWTAVRGLFGTDYVVQLRMINGELSYPDELPPEPWTELRLGTPDGMITVRRDGTELACITWGNAGPGMVEAWNAVTWAFAAAGAGTIKTSACSLTPQQFREANKFPAALRGLS